MIFKGWVLLISSALYIQASEWYSNEDMTTIYEVINKISSESLYFDKNINLPADILKQYIYKIDPYGEYFSKEEYSAFQNTLSQNYVGVGMILYQQNRNSKILCIPMTQKLKDLGVLKYDELISVNGYSVQNKNFYLVSSWIRGKKNSSITFKIKKPSGKIKIITTIRQEQLFQSTYRVSKKGTPMIKIMRFTSETPHELQVILEQWPRNIPVVIDLRGNGGGDFFAAIKSADLFLSENILIATIETKNKYKEYMSMHKDITDNSRVILLQDKFTASASEVFIAALTQNNRGQSVGEKSFGKGVAQKVLPLENGGALLLTYGKIITPNGEEYDKKGLLPTSNLSLGALQKSI
jgi:carboxyl-terminal processing protease